MQHYNTEEHKEILRAQGHHGSKGAGHGKKGGRPRTRGFIEKPPILRSINPLVNHHFYEKFSSLSLEQALKNLAFSKRPDFRAIKLLLKIESKHYDELVKIRDSEEKLYKRRTDQLIQFNLRRVTAPDWLYDEIKELRKSIVDLNDFILERDDEYEEKRKTA